ncbi:MAG: thiamine phosphate synthase [Gemmatimonadales bacterium]
MRPLPRLHAITDDAILADADVGIRAAAIAAAGPAAALHVRGRDSSAAFLAKCATRFTSLATPAEAAVIINARPDLARAVDAQGAAWRRATSRWGRAARPGPGWIGRSVHGVAESREAIDEARTISCWGPSSRPHRIPAGRDSA